MLPAAMDRESRNAWITVGLAFLVPSLMMWPFGFAVFWAGDIITLYAALRAFEVHPAVPALVLAYSTAYVVTMLPLPAGGSGGIEAGLAFSLNAVGIPLAQALVATLVYRFFTLWLPILPAALAAAKVRELDRELPRIPRASIS